MNFLLRLSSRTWIFALVGAGFFLLWTGAAHRARVEQISALAEPAVALDASSPTGYAAGLRRLIVPEHNNGSYQWIAQTQQMLDRGEWRVRHVDYDNAPLGREVRTPSPYRWWLNLVAWCDHAVSGRSPGLAVERAALFADPILQLLLLAGSVIFTARKFGTFPACLLTFGLTLAFPLAGIFLPGQPTDGSLTLACALWSILLLLAGIGVRPASKTDSGEPLRTGRSHGWYFAAGVAGGLGLWVNLTRMAPILGGIAVGGIIAAWITRRAGHEKETGTDGAPWRAWALGGALTCLAAYLLEYSPAHLGGLRLETIHPLHGVAWLGLGELLEQTTALLLRKRSGGRMRRVGHFLLAALALAAVPAVIWHTGVRVMGSDDAVATRLTNLPNSPAAANLWAWIRHDGFTTVSTAALLPLLLLPPVIWILVRRRTDVTAGRQIALALGPVLVSLGFACVQLSWWSMTDLVLLALLVAATAGVRFSPSPDLARWLWSAGAATVLTPSALLLLAAVPPENSEAVTEGEVVALIERDLAHWLANQDGAVVLAPPSLTTSLYFHGGLGGLGTPYWENQNGFAAAVRIAGSTSPEEAQAVARSRHLTHIVLPSWDPFLDEYARLGTGQAEHSLTNMLHRWLPPRWLRPVPYHLPKIAGFDGLSVVVFAVCDEQEDAVAVSRMAEYFVEMNQIDQAAYLGRALEKLFPADLGAITARTLVAHARRDPTAFADALETIQTSLARGDDVALPWDRRVSLAIVLAEGRRTELARTQSARCFTELDEAHLRSLTPGSLYRLLALGKAFGLGISDPHLRELARRLLPVELRNNL